MADLETRGITLLNFSKSMTAQLLLSSMECELSSAVTTGAFELQHSMLALEGRRWVIYGAYLPGRLLLSAASVRSLL